MKASHMCLMALAMIPGLAACSQNLAAPGHETTPMHDPAYGISGQVMDDQGRPATGAYVYAYRNSHSNLRGPADFEAHVGSDSRYFLDLVEGDYFLVARMRHSGNNAGPPRVGDAWALPAKNPVSVKTGEITDVDFVLQQVTQPMLMREGTLTNGDTGFSGLLVGADGLPLPGAFVIAYPNSDFQRMPEATSPVVGDDGRFQLYVARPGTWCLAARVQTRGQPTTGELYGVLGTKETSCRNAVSGQVIDVGMIRLIPHR